MRLDRNRRKTQDETRTGGKHEIGQEQEENIRLDRNRRTT